MLVSFDIKLIRRDQKQCRNGKACQVSPTCSRSNLINLISKDTYMVSNCHALFADLKAKDSETNEKQV